MVRSPSIDKNGIRRGEWSKEEDDKLKAYINRYGIWNWRQLPQFAGLSRCGKSCRLRWKNYLQPNVKRGNYTKEEEDIIINMHHQLGNKWSIIARKLPGRTDNEIKNYWHSHLKKRITQGQNLTLPSNQEKMGSGCQIFETMTEEINKESSQSDNYHKKISTPFTEGSPNESCCSELPQSFWDANLSTDAATSSDLMAWIGEDTTTITPTSFECLDDFGSQAPFELDFYMMNIVNEQQQPLLDHGLVCPSSPEEVFLWSYDLSLE